MRFKVAILEKDKNYLSKITGAFTTRYADKVEVYSFTDEKLVTAHITEKRIDVFIAGDGYDIDVTELPNTCGFAYFVDSSDIESLKGQRAICKYQKVEQIYRQIYDIYAEKAGTNFELKEGEGSCKMIVFASPSGGAGSSTMAAACARYIAAKGKRVMYLNLEDFGGADTFFVGNNQSSMSDIIYALKSKSIKLAMKIESCTQTDSSGVAFFPQANHALNMLELENEEVLTLLDEIRKTDNYDYIVIDKDFGIRKDDFKIYDQCNAWILVGTGTEISNAKIFRCYEAVKTMLGEEAVKTLSRMYLMYNQFSNKTATVLENMDIKRIGGAPRYERASLAQIIEQLSVMTVFDEIM